MYIYIFDFIILVIMLTALLEYYVACSHTTGNGGDFSCPVLKYIF